MNEIFAIKAIHKLSTEDIHQWSQCLCQIAAALSHWTIVATIPPNVLLQRPASTPGLSPSANYTHFPGCVVTLVAAFRCHGRGHYCVTRQQHKTIEKGRKTHFCDKKQYEYMNRFTVIIAWYFRRYMKRNIHSRSFKFDGCTLYFEECNKRRIPLWDIWHTYNTLRPFQIILRKCSWDINK